MRLTTIEQQAPDHLSAELKRLSSSLDHHPIYCTCKSHRHALLPSTQLLCNQSDENDGSCISLRLHSLKNTTDPQRLQLSVSVLESCRLVVWSKQTITNQTRLGLRLSANRQVFSSGLLRADLCTMLGGMRKDRGKSDHAEARADDFRHMISHV